MTVAGGESSPGTWAGIWKCATSMATPATPANATQILVARLDTAVIPPLGARGFLVTAAAGAGWMPASMSWTSPMRHLAGASSLARVDHGGDLQVAVGQRGRVEGAVGGGEAGGSAVDDAVEAGRAPGAGGRPLEGPAVLQVTLAG